MQNNYITEAINLKSYNLSESDKIIIMYSKDNGLIKGIAKGVKKPKSKLGARMDMLAANTVLLHKGRNFNTICQADSLNTFKNTRTNLDKIAYSMYIAEIVSNFGLEGDPASEIIYDLLYKALDSISKAGNKIEVMLSVIKFQFQMMKASGFSLELENCLSCGSKIKDTITYIIPDFGGVICKNCADKIPHNRIQIPSKLRDFFKVMSENDFDQKGEYELKANEKVCMVTYEFLKDYIKQKCPKKIKSSEVIESLII